MNPTDRVRSSSPAAAPRSIMVAPVVPTAARGSPVDPRPARVPSAASSPPGRTIVHVHIERLTIEGIARGDRARLTHALRCKLTELIGTMSERPWRSLPAVDRLDGGVLPVASSPEEIGRHIAGQIVRGLGHARNAPDERAR
jgi:hypothetical protein